MTTITATRPSPTGLKPGFSGKLKRLMLFPSHSLGIKTGIAQRLHARRTARAERELQERGFGPLLLPQAPGALPQDHADLMHLWRAVQDQKAERVIEFGSGQSTVFIAQGLHDQGFGHLWSLDADEKWLAHTKTLIPEHLLPFITFVHSPVELTNDYGPKAWRYTVIPDGKWDFVFLDGPAGVREVPTGSDITVNLIELLPALKPGATGFIDHRWKTTVLTKEILGGKLKLRYVPSLESFTVSKPS